MGSFHPHHTQVWWDLLLWSVMSWGAPFPAVVWVPCASALHPPSLSLPCWCLVSSLLNADAT